MIASGSHVRVPLVRERRRWDEVEEEEDKGVVAHRPYGTYVRQQETATDTDTETETETETE